MVQSEAALKDRVFFLDCGEGRELETERLSGEDLSGWLIPAEWADEFDAQFRSDRIEERWHAFYRFAEWEETGEGIQIRFREY